MIIGIDGNEANVSQQVGVSVYTTNLLRRFQHYATESVQFRIYLREPPNTFLPMESEFFKYRIVKGPTLWSQFFLPLYLATHKEIDVFFSPAHYSPRYCPVPLVVTIHDLSYFYYPQEFLKKDLYKLKNWTQQSIQKAKKVIAVSKTTKKDIVKLYDIPEEKVQVVYNGFEKHHENNPDKEILKTYDLHPQSYFLYVGTLQPRKNVDFLIKTFQKFHQLYSESKLVITGKKGWLYDHIFKQVKAVGLSEKDVIFTDYIHDAKVQAMYQSALAFVMPSLYEGFGIPVLEAMSNGCPVISSHHSSLPEIGADACLYFDPTNEKDLLEEMKLIMTDSKLRDELVQKGKERVKEFSWDKCAEETLKIIVSVVASSK